MIVALLGHYLCFWADARTGTTGTLTISEAQISCRPDKCLLLKLLPFMKKILKSKEKLFKINYLFKIQSLFNLYLNNSIYKIIVQCIKVGAFLVLNLIIVKKEN